MIIRKFDKFNEKFGDEENSESSMKMSYDNRLSDNELTYNGIVPRSPNAEELADIKEYWDDQMGDGKDLTTNYNYAVFDGYSSDGPGYHGKVIFGLFALPSLITIFIYKDGKLVGKQEEIDL